MGRSGAIPHVAAIVLSYNSDRDLPVCAQGLARQEGVRLSLILVDNASRPESLATVEQWLRGWRPDAVHGSEESVTARIREGALPPSGTYFVSNPHNRGYSAGNNTGLRIAQALSADAALIINPDVRIEDPRYVRELTDHLLADPRNAIAASRILDLAGEDQNPLREASFLEELVWPRVLLPQLFRAQSYRVSVSSTVPTIVPKVAGCCLLLDMGFLRDIGLLDEHVFLYCEEAVLASQVRRSGRRMIYVPSVCAVHAHLKSEKGDPNVRMQTFITSRKYYLRTYGGYGALKLLALTASYTLLGLAYRLRKIAGR